MDEPQIRDDDFEDEIEPFDQADIESTSDNDEPLTDVKNFDKKQLFTLARRRVEERLELKRLFEDDDYYSADLEF